MILNEKMTSLWTVLMYSLTMWSAQFVAASADVPCPDIAQLDGSYNMSEKIVYNHFAWIRPNDTQNVVTCSPDCSGTTTYSATKKNTENITTLRIGRVQLRDAGTWAISDTGTQKTPVCHLTVAGLPNCNITSSLSHDSLEPNSELTLVAGIRGYYCSGQAGFELTAGRDVPDVLLKNNTVTGLTDILLNTTFNVTLNRLGNIQLMFSCGNATFDLPCRGVTKLFKSPPECDISSSRNGPLIPGTSLTLTVNITSYYCTEEAAFDLITGSVNQELLPRHHVADINSTVVNKTFNVAPEQSGDIKVNFTCDGTQRVLSCSGDSEIIVASTSASTSTSTSASASTSTSTSASASTSTSASASASASTYTGSVTTWTTIPTSIVTSITTSSSTSPTPASPVYLIIGVVIAVLVLLIIIFVLLVCRNRIARVARKYSVTRKRPKVRNLKENDKPNKGKRMSQINPDKKADFVQSVLGSSTDPASEDTGASVEEMAI